MTAPAIRVLGVDAGGTMTDTIAVDAAGRFVIGKAQTTPADESEGFVASVQDALAYWDVLPDSAFPQMASGVFSGTAMLNRLLERKGRRLGVIVARGFEDQLLMEQGIGTWLGYSYADTLHVITHRHHEPLVPRVRVTGVGGRIDPTGEEVIPLYESDVEQATIELLEAGVECICISFPFSWRNPDHERRAQHIAQAVIEAAGEDVAIRISSEVCPKRLELARLNTMIIDAYAAEPSREHLLNVRKRTTDFGATFDLRIMAAAGTTISIDAPHLVSTLVSGPIGGCVGARYLSQRLDQPNIACADIGGTSFDVALVVGGENEIRPAGDIAHFKMNLPMVRMDSVGAGTGSFVRVSPFSNRLEIGPDSAGSRIGTSNPDGGIDTVTITDCDVALGRLDPDYFLGGELPLDRPRAEAAIYEQLARPLGISVEEVASGVIELFESELGRQLKSTVTGQGFGARDFTLLGYGGGGPLHVAGFSQGLGFDDVLVPSWAAGFSAFGCVCADYAYRLDRQFDQPLPQGDSNGEAGNFIQALNDIWANLRARIAEEFRRSGVAESDIQWQPSLRVQYTGQLNDIEVPVASLEFTGPSDLAGIADTFEAIYGKVYGNAARSPEVGYYVTLGILTGSTEIEKPVLVVEPMAPADDIENARKPTREVYADGRWQPVGIFDLDAMRAGNRIVGPAVLEAPSTTFYVPPGRTATLDQHRIFHLRESETG